MAEMIPFPLAARRRFIDRQAAVALGMKLESGERHITRTITQQREALLRKGCDPRVVAKECAHMEAAIRAAMWILTFRTGGTA